MNTEHLSERFGLLVVIVLGESVLSGVGALNEHWNAASGLAGVLGLCVIALLAWSFFIYGTDAMRTGLEELREAGDYRAIRDTVGFLPFLIVVGVTAISGAIDAAITHPHEPLPGASVIALCGGIAVFYATNAVISLRFGRPLRAVLGWAVPALVLTVLLAIASLALEALLAIVAAAVVLAVIVAISETTNRRRRSAEPVSELPLSPTG